MEKFENEIVNPGNAGKTSNIIGFSWSLNNEELEINMENVLKKIVEAILSTSIESQLNIRIGEKEYEIKVGTRYKENWKDDIDEAIKSKIGEKKLKVEQVDEVRSLLLAPFQMSDKYGEEVLRYYVGNIIECIKNEDIIQEYIFMKKFKELHQNLEKMKGKIGEIRSENEDNNVDLGEKKEKREEGFVWNNVNKLKLVSFIHYLEEKADLSEDCKILINKYREILIAGSSGNFDKRVRIEPSFITDKRFKTKEQRVSISTSISKEDFVSICKNVSEFLGRKLDGKKEYDLRELFEGVKNGDYAIESIDSLKNIKLLNFLGKVPNCKYNVKGNDLIVQIDGKTINAGSKYNPTTELKDLLKKYKYILDDRPIKIGNILKNVFGIDFVLSDGERRDCGRKMDCDLLVFILETLINKINKDREFKNKSINEEIESIKNGRLQTMGLDSNLSKQLELILREIIDFSITDCIDAIELLSRDIEQLEQDLEKCVRDESNIEKNHDIGVIESSIKAKKEDFDKLDELFKWCKSGRDGEYDMDVLKGLNISMGPEKERGGALQIKKLILLKKLFESDMLKQDDKFYYSKVILDIKSVNDRIESRDWGHDEILKDIFGDNDVEANYDIKKLKDVGGDFTSFIEFDVAESVDEKYIKHRLKEKEFTTYRVNEVVGLAILKANLVNRFLDLKKIDFDYEYDLKNSEGEDKETYEIMKAEQKDAKEKESETDFKTDFKSLLKILGVSDEGIEELNRLDKLFPGVLESYLNGCLSVGALKFGDSNAVDYSRGSLDFSIIQAGILEKAVEDGKGLEVLKYLGFFLNEESLGNIAEQGTKNPAFINQVKQFIKYLYNLKQGCFSEKYLGYKKTSYVNEWRKLDFKEGNDFLRKKTTQNKFGIGKSGQDFRLVGISNHGFYCILKCFVDEHDTYEVYLGKKVSEDEKKLFEEMTGKSW